MKKYFVLPLIFALILAIGISSGLGYSAVSNKSIDYPKAVVIDAGHGGVDAGAIAIDGTAEKGINLDIAKATYDFLMISGYNSILIRDGDYEIYPNGYDRSRSDLYNRMDLINNVPNSIMVSIHQNHFNDEKENGTQIWYSANDNQSKIIADSILYNIKYYLQPTNKRKNKESGDNYYLLYKAQVPSIMVECGFISNKQETTKLKNKKYQEDMAYSILLGLNGVI